MSGKSPHVHHHVHHVPDGGHHHGGGKHGRGNGHGHGHGHGHGSGNGNCDCHDCHGHGHCYCFEVPAKPEKPKAEEPPPPPKPEPKKPEHAPTDAILWGGGSGGGGDFTQPFGAMKPPPSSGVVAAPIAGYGTYQEARGQWEDESGTQHYNHSLFNENAQKEESANRCGELHTRHVQHTTFLKNEPAGQLRTFEHQSLDSNRDGHDLDPLTGSRRDYKERQSYYHQNEIEEDTKAGVMRQYENKHLNQYKTIKDHKDPKKERVHAFEHRNFNYSYKGVPFVPEAIMEASSKNRKQFEDDIKKSFQTLPLNNGNNMASNRAHWDADFPPAPRLPGPFASDK
ncbi:hypothetical protein GQ42DRAFT_46728 [Ramicandelaber brevisporus]|nr:hypothetical protein GQ42DRAFT_46728 [Ramicandelaber brevisporus]